MAQVLCACGWRDATRTDVVEADGLSVAVHAIPGCYGYTKPAHAGPERAPPQASSTKQEHST